MRTLSGNDGTMIGAMYNMYRVVVVVVVVVLAVVVVVVVVVTVVVISNTRHNTHSEGHTRGKRDGLMELQQHQCEEPTKGKTSRGRACSRQLHRAPRAQQWGEGGKRGRGGPRE